MNPIEIRVARIRCGLTQKHMAEQLGISACSYSKKEKGEVRFTDPEKVAVTKVLGLTAEQVNDFFFDGKLPIG